MGKAKRIRRTLLLLSLAWLAASAAQESRAQGSREAGPQPPHARQIDEYGRLYGCDHGARLDNLAILLQNEVPETRAYVVAYDARTRAPGVARVWLGIIRQYMTELRGVEESRVVTVYAGRHAGDDIKTELWLVPPGADPPRTSPLREKPGAEFSGKFDKYHFYDSTAFYDTDGADAASFSHGVILDAFTDTLKRQKESQGYLVVYTRADADPYAWRRVGLREQKRLAGGEVGAERLAVVDGGSKGLGKDEAGGRVELWVGRKGEPPPVRGARRRASPAESFLVGDLGSAADDEEVGTWVLDNIAEALKADAGSRACIVVHPPQEYGLSYDGEGRERPPVDIYKLAERWKAELVARRGLDEARIVFLNGPASFWNDGTLEAWVVPRGAALPDPFAQDDITDEKEEEGDVMEEITATELKQRLDRGDDLQIIDVREPNEYETARLPNSKLIPLGEVVGRRGEIDEGRETVVHCKGGVRSAKAIEDLRRAGFKGRLVNLKGGITAWSNDVDPSVPKY